MAACTSNRAQEDYDPYEGWRNNIGWSGGGGGSSTHGRTDSDGAEQRPPGRPLLCLPERAVCASRSAADGGGSAAAAATVSPHASTRSDAYTLALPLRGDRDIAGNAAGRSDIRHGFAQLVVGFSNTKQL